MVALLELVALSYRGHMVYQVNGYQVNGHQVTSYQVTSYLVTSYLVTRLPVYHVTGYRVTSLPVTRSLVTSYLWKRLEKLKAIVLRKTRFRLLTLRRHRALPRTP